MINAQLFQRPFKAGGLVYNAWATCPVTDEPILVAMGARVKLPKMASEINFKGKMNITQGEFNDFVDKMLGSTEGE